MDRTTTPRTRRGARSRISWSRPERPRWLPSRRGRIILLAIAAALAGWWLRPHKATTVVLRGVGERVADFTLPDTSGGLVSLGGLAGKKRAVVLAFCGIDCPIGNLYMPRLVKLARTYAQREVAFIAINSNAHESLAEMGRHAREYHVNFPVVKDENNRVADQLLADRTCEVLVLDNSLRLRYRGAIDDQYNLGSRRDRPTRQYLVEALDAVLAGRTVALAATTVVGCPIDRVTIAAAPGKLPRVRPASRVIMQALSDRDGSSGSTLDVGRVTYATEVAAIIQHKCQACHRPGQVAPFPLLTYEHAYRWRTAIREVVEDRRMPPWHADPRYGHFENDRSLTPRERAILLAWVDQDAPSGNLASAPAHKAFAAGWSIGTPDIVIDMPEPFVVPAQGTLPYYRFRMPSGFAQDTWVERVEIRPGDRSVIHHMFVSVEKHDTNLKHLHRQGPYLASYVPGEVPSIYPSGTAKLIPAGCDFLFEIHYTPVGKPKIDRSSVGLVLAKGPVHHEAMMYGIRQNNMLIPAGAANHPVVATYTVPTDIHVLGLWPHMHLRGKDFTFTAIYPSGEREILLSVPAYDFAWQTLYRLAEPKPIPRGTKIECLAHYDNSAQNPANPDPTKDVGWGDQTWNEMMIGYIDYYDDVRTDGSAAAGPAGD